MRFLVTGANGFVGKHLCAELLRQGQPVRAAVRSASPPVDGIEVAVVGAIDGETNWIHALHDVDVIIHLAARVHVMKDTAADPLAEFLKVNTQGTANLARQAAAAGVKRLVYVSSIKVNGERTAETQPFAESGRCRLRSTRLSGATRATITYGKRCSGRRIARDTERAFTCARYYR